jgi:phosphatidylinositol 4-kinase
MSNRSRSIFDLVCRMLEKDLLSFLDGLALDVYVSGGVARFPYKSFSETLNLVMVSMLREVVKSSGKSRS